MSGAQLLLDTNALLFWTLQPQRLSAKAAKAISAAEASGLLVCSMSLWEIAWKQRSGKLDIGMAASEYASRLLRLSVELVSVDAPLWLRSAALYWEHRDPVDRLIVALAQHQQLSLVTSDKRMRDYYPEAVW